MSHWRYKILPKTKVKELVEKYKPYLYLEYVYSGGLGIHLELKTDKGVKTLGRVSKNIEKWYELIPTTEQPDYINIKWFKFK